MISTARGILALAVGLALAATASAAVAADRHPYRLVVSVRWGEGAGSDAFRVDVGRALAESLAGGCFAAVEIAESDPAATRADLVLEVLLSGVEDETRFEDPIATALEPGEPSKELRRVARYEVAVDATLRAAGGAAVQSKRLVADISRRPIMVGEDPQAVARSMALDRIVTDLTKSLCRGGDKLERKIRAAFDAPAGGTPPER